MGPIYLLHEYANAHICMVMTINIEALRKKTGLSQAAIAAKLGVHQTTVQRWEKGDLPMKPRDEFAVQVAIDALSSEARGA